VWPSPASASPSLYNINEDGWWIGAVVGQDESAVGGLILEDGFLKNRTLMEILNSKFKISNKSEVSEQTPKPKTKTEGPV
jgi:hypothetical protein